MLPSTAFRSSTYLTLAIACTSLGYAESAMLPEVGVFAIAVVITLAVIYRLETRVRLLSLDEANRLGAGIGLAAILWAGFRVVREVNASEFAALGWPVFFVALMAPLLMAAVCAKLLRREKHAGDYWFMHAAGLAAMVLAGAMAEQTLLVALTAAYVLCAIWSLFQFFLARSNGIVPRIPDRKAAKKPLPVVRTIAAGTPLGGRSGLLRAALWASVAAAAAVPIYLITPRSTYGKIDFGQSRIEVGFAADQMIDLTQTGDLRDNPETAFEFTATDNAGRPKEDLNPEQRWRGAVLATYSNGTWRRDAFVRLSTSPPILPQNGPWIPPDLGPESYRLTFTVPTKLRSTFLADPVAWVPGAMAAVADLPPNGSPEAWVATTNGLVFGRPGSRRPVGSEHHYVQHTRPPAEADLSPPYPASDLSPIAIIRSNAIPRVKEYADKVLADAVAAGRVPEAALARDSIRLLPLEPHHEAIARAFREHLSERADLTYTTSLKRDRKDLDPVEDFLFHSKVGHCERFATALVLMLRAEGIPAVMVLGFKGCEHTGEGHYIVRQEYAHAWAEALISRPDRTAPRGHVWHWLSLDPAPAQAAETNSNDTAGSFWNWSKAFERYLFHYTPEERDRAIRSAFDAATSAKVLGGAAVVVLAFPILRFVRRRIARTRPRAAPPSAQWFDRLLVVLGKHGFAPAPGETAREFATATAATLEGTPATRAVAAVPIEWAEAYYRSRFGDDPVPDARRVELERGLEDLKLALERERGRRTR